MSTVGWPPRIRALVLDVRGRQALALTEYRRILDSDPSHFTALFTVLEDCRQRRDVAEAIVLANRALACDSTSFIALDGLAWAYLKQGDHHQAKAAIERALQAIDGFDVGGAFRSARIMIWVVRLVLRLPGLRRRYPHLRSNSEMEAQAARGIAEWKTWALQYLAWYDREYAQGPTND